MKPRRITATLYYLPQYEEITRLGFISQSEYVDIAIRILQLAMQKPENLHLIQQLLHERRKIQRQHEIKQEVKHEG